MPTCVISIWLQCDAFSLRLLHVSYRKYQDYATFSAALVVFNNLNSSNRNPVVFDLGRKDPQPRSCVPAADRSRSRSPSPAPAVAVQVPGAPAPVPFAVRQQEAAARLSRGSAAHSAAAASRRRSSPFVSPPPSFAYLERHAGAGTLPPDCPVPLPALRPAGTPAGIPARPTMAGIRTGTRAAGQEAHDGSSMKSDPPSGQSMPGGPSERGRSRSSSPGPLRQWPQAGNASPVAARVFHSLLIMRFPMP